MEDYKQKDKYQKQRLLDDISYLKKNSVDYIVMCLHCGGQYNDYPTNYTLETIRYLLENGADFVVCNHEHLIQGSSFLGEKGATYCLGNFTCNYGITRWPWDKQAECSIMFHLYLSKTGGALRKQYAFSVLHSRKNDNGIIVTSPIYDDYVKTNDKKMKKELELLNTKCISRFMGYTSDNVIIPHEEYFVDDLKPNIAGWL